MDRNTKLATIPNGRPQGKKMNNASLGWLVKTSNHLVKPLAERPHTGILAITAGI